MPKKDKQAKATGTTDTTDNSFDETFLDLTPQGTPTGRTSTVSAGWLFGGGKKNK